MCSYIRPFSFGWLVGVRLFAELPVRLLACLTVFCVCVCVFVCVCVLNLFAWLCVRLVA